MNKRLVFIGLGVIAAIILLSGSLFIVREANIRFVMKFGEAVRYVDEPGMQMKIPFIESVTFLP